MVERLVSQPWVWKGTAKGDIFLRFERDGNQLLAHLSDGQGGLSPRRILSPADRNHHTEQLRLLRLTILEELTGRPEYAVMNPEERREVTREVMQKNAQISSLEEQLEASRTVRNAYEALRLPPNAFSVFPTRDGAVLQARYGQLVRLYYLAPTPDGLGLYFYHQPGAMGMGAYFPDRPGRWARIQRRFGFVGGRGGAAALAYHRAPDTLVFPTMTLGDPDAELDWPMRLTLLRGGEPAVQLLDFIGEAGWHAPSRIELTPLAGL